MRNHPRPVCESVCEIAVTLSLAEVTLGSLMKSLLHSSLNCHLTHSEGKSSELGTFPVMTQSGQSGVENFREASNHSDGSFKCESVFLQGVRDIESKLH